ncbi:hypothetical protein V8J82_11935 [Gymnodinialimonas sp. 2305UL16-5]|uniref:hypothetical protein n=1 Tax=Gymnodinialimonas mytili TaxID=3126503 RepID=UPI0030B0A978
MNRLSLAVCAAFFVLPTMASANAIERACNASDGGSSRALCSCIGGVADATLSRGQIREGARWFDDPQRAQDVRQSDRRRDEEMWQAWRQFSTLAEQRCTG